MRILISVGIWVLLLVLLLAKVISVEVFWSLAVFGMFYRAGNGAAEVDRYTEITNITLPLLLRRILFLGQPNPFRRKTVVFQAILVLSLTVALVIALIFPGTIASYTALWVLIFGSFIQSIACDLKIDMKMRGGRYRGISLIDEIRSTSSYDWLRTIFWVAVFLVIIGIFWIASLLR